MPCVVFTFVGAGRPLVTQMRAYGAMVVDGRAQGRPLAAAVGRRARVRLVSDIAVLRSGVGSNPYGMEGYKTIAYEIAEAFDWEPPDWCVLPVCYGDALLRHVEGF